MGVKTSLRIGALAKATGRTTHAIRWYEQEGLMPGVTRDAGGHRIYEPGHIDWLLFLDRLRFTGMSVKRMRAYAVLARKGRASLPDRETLLAAHGAEVEARIAELTQALDLIGRKVAYYREWQREGRRPEIMPTAGRPALPDKTTAARKPAKETRPTR